MELMIESGFDWCGILFVSIVIKIVNVRKFVIEKEIFLLDLIGSRKIIMFMDKIKMIGRNMFIMRNEDCCFICRLIVIDVFFIFELRIVIFYCLLFLKVLFFIICLWGLN